MPQRISITIDGPFQEQADEAWLRSIGTRLLDLLDASEVLEVHVTGDQVMADLNRVYHGEEGTTDVLSFPAQGGEGEFVWPPGVVAPLGEVVLCLPQAQRQAEERGHGLKEEMAHLLAHGLLHLLGHDHADEASAHEMRTREETLLAIILPGSPSVHA